MSPTIKKICRESTCIQDKSLADLKNLPDPDVIAEEIVENLEDRLLYFKQIINSFGKGL